MNATKFRNYLVLALWLVMGLAPFFAGGAYLFAKHKFAEEQLVKLEPRIARLAGLKSDKALLEEKSKLVGETLQKQTYPASQDVTQSGNDAQQKLRALFSAAGLEVVSSQVLAPKQEKDFDRIPLVFRLEGQLAGLQSAMLILSAQSPVVLVEGFNVQTVGYVRAESPQRLAIQFNLAVLRLRS